MRSFANDSMEREEAQTLRPGGTDTEMQDQGGSEKVTRFHWGTSGSRDPGKFHLNDSIRTNPRVGAEFSQ